MPEKFWLALLQGGGAGWTSPRMSGLRAAISRRENFQALERELAPTFAAKSRDEWLKVLEAHDVPAVALYNVAEVLDDPQVRHLDLIEEVDHPDGGQIEVRRRAGSLRKYDQGAIRAAAARG